MANKKADGNLLKIGPRLQANDWSELEYNIIETLGKKSISGSVLDWAGNITNLPQGLLLSEKLAKKAIHKAIQRWGGVRNDLNLYILFYRKRHPSDGRPLSHIPDHVKRWLPKAKRGENNGRKEHAGTHAKTKLGY